MEHRRRPRRLQEVQDRDAPYGSAEPVDLPAVKQKARETDRGLCFCLTQRFLFTASSRHYFFNSKSKTFWPAFSVTVAEKPDVVGSA